MGRTLAVAIWLVVLSAATARAQEIRGQVIDRINRQRGLAGAEVVVLNTTLSAVTDDSGRFVIAGVRPGRYTLMASHPTLDTLTLPALEVEISVESGAPASALLSTPSFAEYSQERCGRALEPHEAIVHGIARSPEGAPLRGAAVTASWQERTVSSGAASQVAREATATAEGSGWFTLCGLPRGESVREGPAGAAIARSEVRLVAVAGGEAGAPATPPLIMLQLDGGVARHDLVLGDADAATFAVGRVVDEAGNPLRARIVRSGDSTASVQTDAQGRFRIPVPLRSEQLLVRALAKMPMTIEFAADGAELDLGTITMPAMVFGLTAVEIRALYRSPERREFDERRAIGLGKYITDEDMKKLPRLTPHVLASYVPQAEVVQVGPGERMFMLRRLSFGTRVCTPRWFMDGNPLGSMSASEQEFFLSLAVRVEVYTAQFAPARFTDFHGCGVVVLWSR